MKKSFNENKKVKIKSPKAADPGLAFILETEDQSGFDSELIVTVKVHGQSAYETVIHIKNKVIEPELDFIAPFGDANWENEVLLQHELNYTISVEFLTATGGPYTETVSGMVLPEKADFVVSTIPAFGPGAEGAT